MRIRIGTVAELPADGRAREFDCAGTSICVARIEGRLAALGNVCPHRGGPISDGVVMDGTIICPWHGWQFDPVTGKSLQLPSAGVDVYEISIDGDEVYIDK